MGFLRKKGKYKYSPKYNFFLSPERLFSRNDIKSDKVNFRPDIRQHFFLKKTEQLEFGS